MSRMVVRTCGALLLLGACFWPRSGYAQTPDELQAARKLFADAVQDEEHARYVAALEKFRRVQSVKDTSTVRYRIAVCLDALGRLDEASLEYDAAAQKADASQREMAASAAQKAASARLRMGQITVDVAGSPGDAEVRLDSQVMPPNRLGTPQKVNPGKHVIDADAKGRPHFHAELEVRESASTQVRVSFGSPTSTDPAGPATSPEPEAASGQRTAGWITFASGLTAMTVGVSLLIVRDGQINSIKQLCPNNHCPASSQDAVTSKQSSARVLGPFGWTLATLGVAATAVGAYLLITLPKERRSTAFIVPTLGGLEAVWATRF